MARGFESKSVADQQAQAEAESRREPRIDHTPADPAVAVRRRSLELARADMRHRLEQSNDDRYRTMVETAIADLDRQIGALGVA